MKASVAVMVMETVAIIRPRIKVTTPIPVPVPVFETCRPAALPSSTIRSFADADLRRFTRLAPAARLSLIACSAAPRNVARSRLGAASEIPRRSP
jgi:hypothetical protein